MEPNTTRFGVYLQLEHVGGHFGCQPLQKSMKTADSM